MPAAGIERAVGSLADGKEAVVTCVWPRRNSRRGSPASATLPTTPQNRPARIVARGNAPLEFQGGLIGGSLQHRVCRSNRGLVVVVGKKAPERLKPRPGGGIEQMALASADRSQRPPREWEIKMGRRRTDRQGCSAPRQRDSSNGRPAEASHDFPSRWDHAMGFEAGDHRWLKARSPIFLCWRRGGRLARGAHQPGGAACGDLCPGLVRRGLCGRVHPVRPLLPGERGVGRLPAPRSGAQLNVKAEQVLILYRVKSGAIRSELWRVVQCGGLGPAGAPRAPRPHTDLVKQSPGGRFLGGRGWSPGRHGKGSDDHRTLATCVTYAVGDAGSRLWQGHGGPGVGGSSTR